MCGLSAAAAGSGLLIFAVLDTAKSGAWAYIAWFVALGASGTIWHLFLRRFRPESIDAIGVFDSVATADLLPGSADLEMSAAGKPVLTPPHHGS